MIASETRRQLSEAIHSGDLAKIRSIASRTPAAIHEGWLGMPGGPSYLHIAARKGKTDVCALLAEMGLDVNGPAQEEGNGVPLEDAATGGHIETVRWLLAHGAKTDGLSTSVATPLMGAAVEGHVEVARLLLDAGAEINREHLRLPQTALDFAELYRVKQSGQDAVAALLRERGGIRPYTERHDWDCVPGQLYIEHIERAVGSFVNPLVTSRLELSQRRALAIYKVRIPNKYDYQLLFTVGLASTGFELAVCLPSAWPISQSSLQDPRFYWPINMLNKLGAAQLDGLGLSHGDVLNADHPALTGIDVADGIKQWVVALNQIIETEREGDSKIARTLLLVPITTKKPLKPGSEALALADKKGQAKWDKIALNVP